MSFTKAELAELERIRAEFLNEKKEVLGDVGDDDCVTRDEVVQLWENIERYRAVTCTRSLRGLARGLPRSLRRLARVHRAGRGHHL
jgi:hypothetical protein